MVLASTEPYKIPATVLSRCQRFDFRPIPLTAMIERLRGIASREGLVVEDGALELIAQQSTGSLRDAESLLDQLASFAGTRCISGDIFTAAFIGFYNPRNKIVPHHVFLVKPDPPHTVQSAQKFYGLNETRCLPFRQIGLTWIAVDDHA